MMDTVLNLGLNDTIVEGLAKQAGNERFALDCYRRLLQMFGDVVLGIPHDEFEHEIVELKKKAGVKARCRASGGETGARCAWLVGVYVDAVWTWGTKEPARARTLRGGGDARCKPTQPFWLAAYGPGSARARHETRPAPQTPPLLQFDCELGPADLRELVTAYKGVYARNKLQLPQDPWEQLRMGIDAVFRCALACGTKATRR